MPPRPIDSPTRRAVDAERSMMPLLCSSLFSRAEGQQRRGIILPPIRRGRFHTSVRRLKLFSLMAMEPRGLLCDEITSALDPELKGEVLAVLEDLKRDGLTLVVVTHEIGLARRAADRIVVLDAGKVVEEGPPGQVLDHPQTARTRQFLSQVLA